VELNINAIGGGAKYRGEFEERVQKVLKEVTEHQGELILFIGEVHTIVGAGQGGGERAGRGQRVQTDDGAR
jgi:ATP-dependent Clp protease ATP-binding subunit ClpC